MRVHDVHDIPPSRATRSRTSSRTPRTSRPRRSRRAGFGTGRGRGDRRRGEGVGGLARLRSEGRQDTPLRQAPQETAGHAEAASPWRRGRSGAPAGREAAQPARVRKKKREPRPPAPELWGLGLVAVGLVLATCSGSDGTVDRSDAGLAVAPRRRRRGGSARPARPAGDRGADARAERARRPPAVPDGPRGRAGRADDRPRGGPRRAASGPRSAAVSRGVLGGVGALIVGVGSCSREVVSSPVRPRGPCLGALRSRGARQADGRAPLHRKHRLGRVERRTLGADGEAVPPRRARTPGPVLWSGALSRRRRRGSRSRPSPPPRRPGPTTSRRTVDPPMMWCSPSMPATVCPYRLPDRTASTASPPSRSGICATWESARRRCWYPAHFGVDATVVGMIAAAGSCATSRSSRRGRRLEGRRPQGRTSRRAGDDRDPTSRRSREAGRSASRFRPSRRAGDAGRHLRATAGSGEPAVRRPQGHPRSTRSGPISRGRRPPHRRTTGSGSGLHQHDAHVAVLLRERRRRAADPGSTRSASS